MTADESAHDLKHLPLVDLFSLYRAILAELRQWGVVRTDNAPAGDYAEYLVAAAFNGALAANSEKSGAYGPKAGNGEKLAIAAGGFAGFSYPSGDTPLPDDLNRLQIGPSGYPSLGSTGQAAPPFDSPPADPNAVPGRGRSGLDRPERGPRRLGRHRWDRDRHPRQRRAARRLSGTVPTERRWANQGAVHVLPGGRPAKRAPGDSPQLRHSRGQWPTTDHPHKLQVQPGGHGHLSAPWLGCGRTVIARRLFGRIRMVGIALLATGSLLVAGCGSSTGQSNQATSLCGTMLPATRHGQQLENQVAAYVQGRSPNNVSRAQIDGFVNDYAQAFARATALVPPEQHGAFQSQADLFHQAQGFLHEKNTSNDQVLAQVVQLVQQHATTADAATAYILQRCGGRQAVYGPSAPSSNGTG